jgi:hypothetical protein
VVETDSSSEETCGQGNQVNSNLVNNARKKEGNASAPTANQTWYIETTNKRHSLQSLSDSLSLGTIGKTVAAVIVRGEVPTHFSSYSMQLMMKSTAPFTPNFRTLSEMS